MSSGATDPDSIGQASSGPASESNRKTIPKTNSATIEVGLTGGIASGKSTASALFKEFGAAIVDADQIVKDLQQPGQAVFDAIVQHFGEDVKTSAGELDRKRLASIVFSNPQQLQALNSLVHPAVHREIERQREQFAQNHQVVILDIPLLNPKNYPNLDAIVVVDAPIEQVVERLKKHRSYTESEALERINSQISSEERTKNADYVIDNSTSLKDFELAVASCWSWLKDLAEKKSYNGEI